MSERNFQRLGALIETTCGIRMPPTKKTMVEGRLRRRVRALDLESMDEYCLQLLEGGRLDGELVELIDAITTNKTDFFREGDHFRFLMETGLDRLAAMPHRPGIDRPLKLWSAACSIGAEPYTLAMLFAERARQRSPFRHDIVATDICTEVLAKAKMGIYPAEMFAAVPMDLARRYARRSRDQIRPTVRMVPAIRQSVRFGQLNLMDDSYGLAQDMDIIFCRNILIYFDKEVQRSVLLKLCGHLRPGGLLFVGHSEAIAGQNLPLVQVATAIFAKG